LPESGIGICTAWGGRKWERKAKMPGARGIARIRETPRATITLETESGSVAALISNS